jgi:hypothetical protein
MLVEVGDIVQMHTKTPVLLRHDVTCGFFEFAELAAKCYLLFIIQMLVVKYEHTIVIHACMDGGDLGVTEGTRQVNA